MAAFLKRYALLVFLILTLLISWFPWYTGGTGFFVFGPTIAGLITTILVAGKEGMRELWQRALRWKVGLLWWLVALFLPALLTLIALGISLLMGGEVPPFTFLRQEWYLLPVFFIITIVGGPLGEEFGWRGFALPRLQEKWGPLVASLVIGIVWGLWHLPSFFQPGTVHAELGLGLLPVYVVAEMGLATIMTWVYNKTRGSLLVGGLIYHNADNFWGVVLLTGVTMTTAFQGGEAGINMLVWKLSAGVGVLAAILLAVITKGRLGLPKEDDKPAG